MTRLRTILLASVAGLSAAAAQAQAQTKFPVKPIKLVVPFGAGGATHTLARLFADDLAKAIGQRVVVTAAPGSGGAIGSAQVARSKPDGYTLSMGSNGTNGMRWQISETGYTLDSFRPLGAVACLPTGVAVKSDSPIKSVKQFIDHVKKNPDIKYASVGTGSSVHVATEQFAELAGLKITHIGARGGKDAIVKLLSGEVQFVAVAASNFPAQFSKGKTGQLRPIFVTSDEPYEFAPQVETLKSAGYNFTDFTWWGPMAVNGTPAPVMEKLASAVEKAAKSETFKNTLKKFNYTGCFKNAKDAWADLQAYAKRQEGTLKKLGMHKDLAKKQK
ncbi:MAG: tripartite tricarboxylate transporter substrate binding protein [Beijerinckiaceae bacterium]